jgi:hypothetical protein
MSICKPHIICLQERDMGKKYRVYAALILWYGNEYYRLWDCENPRNTDFDFHPILILFFGFGFKISEV